MYRRNFYFNKILPFVDKPVIKVITGMRRVGKSFFLKQIIEELQTSKKVPAKNILYIDKESLEFDFIQTYKDLNTYVEKGFKGVSGKKYLLIDEIQAIEKWEKVVASIFGEGKVDIFITGSNANLLSSELATLLAGRYVEFTIYPLSFEEFVAFSQKAEMPANALFQLYTRFGGLPGIHPFNFDEASTFQYLNALYSAILLKDVVTRYQVRHITLLDGITKYIFDNVGNIFSAKKVSDYLKSQKQAVGVETVHTYISYLVATFCLHKVERFDIKGKRLLEINEKYYLGDVGLRHALLGYKQENIGGILENIVFLELKRQGYTVYVGKIGDKEIDFIALKPKKQIYIQVAYSLATQEVVEREFSSLISVPDNYPKLVISADPFWEGNSKGVQWCNILDFLMKPQAYLD